MSWLSQGLSDVGLGGVNTFFNSAVKPALENPIVDVGLGVGAAALTGGLLAPELAGIFGAGTAADAAAVGAPLDLLAGGAGGGAADASTALGFSGDVSGASTLSGFPNLASDSALSGNVTPVSGLPNLGGAASGAGTSFGTDAAFGGPPAFTADTSLLTPDTSGGLLTLDGTTSGVPSSIVSNAPQTGASTGNIFSGIANSLTNQITNQPLTTLGAAAGVGGLGYNLYQGYQQKQQLNALTNTENQQAQTAQANAAAATAAAQPELTSGELLQSYLQTGTLPPAIQAQVQQQVAAAKAQITQGYASRGMATDPNQNSALAQDLANVDTQAQALQGNLETQMNQAGTQMVQTANSLLSQGVSATNISAQIPIAMQNLNIALGTQTSQAISSFAAAINSGNKVTLNVQPTQQAA